MASKPADPSGPGENQNLPAGAHGPAPNGEQSLGPIFSSIIQNFPMPFFTVDTSFTITYMNAHLEDLTGYSRSEAVHRMTCAELCKSNFCHTEKCPLKHAMENRVSVSGLRSFLRDRNGREIPVSSHCSMITDADDRVIGGFKAIRDISSIVEAEQKIRMLLEITQEGVLMIDENSRVLYANSKMAEITGRPKDAIIGRDVSEFIPYQHLGIVHDLMQKVGPEHPQQLRFCSTIQPSKDTGHEDLAFETCIVAARAGNGTIAGMYFHELTKHIAIERQLFNTNSFLSNIIMSSADGIVVVDTSMNVMIFNEAAERILGHTADEVVGVPGALSKVYTPGLAKDIMRRMRSGEQGLPGKLPSTRMTLFRKDGEEVPVNFSAAIIKKGDREIGSVGIFSDLRERMRIRQELEEAKTQLMQAEKIASIGRLAAGVAHEINNPLSGILIFADMLMKDLEHNPQWREDMQEIITQTLRCKEIVTRLLDFSRQSVGQKLSLDINNIITRSAQMLSNQALFHNVEIVTGLDPDVPPITGDGGQLQQVFINLILNAGTAIGGKGKITVTSRFDPLSGRVVMQFEDTGPGIAPEILDKIFEPFFTTKAPGEGTGLGLSVAYGIIQQHGGSITAENSAGGGALFTVVLPVDGHDQDGATIG